MDGNQLANEVNSRTRLDTVTRTLPKLGVADLLIERRLDLALDLPMEPSWRPVAEAGFPEAEAIVAKTLAGGATVRSR